MEAFYYAFRDTDLYVIVDAPDNVSAATMSLVACAAGGVEVSVSVLWTAEEVDDACKRSATYTAPGQ